MFRLSINARNDGFSIAFNHFTRTRAFKDSRGQQFAQHRGDLADFRSKVFDKAATGQWVFDNCRSRDHHQAAWPPSISVVSP